MGAAAAVGVCRAQQPTPSCAGPDPGQAVGRRPRRLSRIHHTTACAPPTPPHPTTLPQLRAGQRLVCAGRAALGVRPAGPLPLQVLCACAVSTGGWRLGPGLGCTPGVCAGSGSASSSSHKRRPAGAPGMQRPHAPHDPPTPAPRTQVTSISPWVVTPDALQPFACAAPPQDEPQPLPYLRQAAGQRTNYDVQLQAAIQPGAAGAAAAGGAAAAAAGGGGGAAAAAEPSVVTRTNLRTLYWTLPQVGWALSRAAVAGLLLGCLGQQANPCCLALNTRR